MTRSWTSRLRGKVFGWLSLATIVMAGPAVGQAPRELDYKVLAVRAKITDAGVLRIEERHFLLMTGDWNGAER